MKDEQNHRERIDPVVLRRLSNSVEVIGSIFYLLELHTAHPEQIEHFLAIGKPVLEELVDFVRGEFAKSS